MDVKNKQQNRVLLNFKDIPHKPIPKRLINDHIESINDAGKQINNALFF